MPRTSKGWSGDYSPLVLNVTHEAQRVLFGIVGKSDLRIAVDLSSEAANMLAMLGRIDTNGAAYPHDLKAEVLGKLLVVDGGELAACDPGLERWEGKPRPLQVGFQVEERQTIFSMRDPVARVGFDLKLPVLARNALFAAIIQPRMKTNEELDASGSIEGTLEVTQ